VSALRAASLQAPRGLRHRDIARDAYGPDGTSAQIAHAALHEISDDPRQLCSVGAELHSMARDGEYRDFARLVGLLRDCVRVATAARDHAFASIDAGGGLGQDRQQVDIELDEDEGGALPLETLSALVPTASERLADVLEHSGHPLEAADVLLDAVADAEAFRVRQQQRHQGVDDDTPTSHPVTETETEAAAVYIVAVAGEVGTGALWRNSSMAWDPVIASILSLARGFADTGAHVVVLHDADPADLLVAARMAQSKPAIDDGDDGPGAQPSAQGLEWLDRVEFAHHRDPRASRPACSLMVSVMRPELLSLGTACSEGRVMWALQLGGDHTGSGLSTDGHGSSASGGGRHNAIPAGLLSARGRAHVDLVVAATRASAIAFRAALGGGGTRVTTLRAGWDSVTLHAGRARLAAAAPLATGPITTFVYVGPVGRTLVSLVRTWPHVHRRLSRDTAAGHAHASATRVRLTVLVARPGAGDGNNKNSNQGGPGPKPTTVEGIPDGSALTTKKSSSDAAEGTGRDAAISPILDTFARNAAPPGSVIVHDPHTWTLADVEAVAARGAGCIAFAGQGDLEAGVEFYTNLLRRTGCVIVAAQEPEPAIAAATAWDDARRARERDTLVREAQTWHDTALKIRTLLRDRK
jgi:hypothetical protein